MLGVPGRASRQTSAGRGEHRTAGEHPGQVLTVVGCGVGVARSGRALGGALGRRTDRLGGGRLPDQRLLDGRGARSGVVPMLVSPTLASAIVPPSARTAAATPTSTRPARSGRTSRSGCPSRCSFGNRTSVRISSSPSAVVEVVDEEVVRRTRSRCRPARRSPTPPRAPGRRAQVTGRIGVRERAAERARGAGPGCRPPSPSAWASSPTCSVTSSSRMTSWCVVIAPIAIRSPSSRMPRSSGSRPGRSAADGAASRSRSTGMQALPAGEDLGVLTALLQRGHRLVDRAGPDVVELRRDHWTSSSCGLFGSIEPRPAPGEWVSTGVSCVARPCAAWIARHTRCGVQGISTSVTPRWRTASSDAR